ncbi:uncharacterized protein [Pocillopora verrucosa]|uniref:uncharacterized protein isoform X3 n=1 Tax=Pocillopora verrucosa TaxID=203993 RepID=UPI0033403F5F
MLLLAEAGRTLNKDLTSLFRHNLQTPHVLDRLVHELHSDKELCSYLFLNHPGSEDMLWGLMNLLMEDSRTAGNASYVIGTLAETDLGKRRIVQICTDKGDQAKKILPALTNMLDMADTETVMNAAGTMGTLAEDGECRMWMLREDCLDEAIIKLTNLLSSKDMCTASNAALVLARLTIAEEGCARILNHRSSSHTLVQLCRALGSDETGRGMNAAFAIGRLCDFEAGCKRMLSLKTSNLMVIKVAINSLIDMLHSADSGCSKNACFALSCIASLAQGHQRLLNHEKINSIVDILCSLLAASDEECIWFASMMLHTFASQKSGCLYLRTQPNVRESLEALLERPSLKEDTKEEVEATLAILEKLPRPKPPNIKVESAYSIIVSWDPIHPKSGLDVTYLLFQDEKLVYSGPRTSYIANDLTPNTKYSFYLQASTEGDDSPLSKNVSVVTPESVPSAPQSLQVLNKSTSQIKIMWEPPETSNGVLKGYQIVVRGKTSSLEVHENYFILSSLPPDTEFTFQVFALTSKGRGEAAILTTATDDLASHAPPKPVVQVLGRHELMISWESPPKPLGRINSYEVRVDDVAIYNGVEKSCTAKSLKPNTEYSITVSAWCSEGRCESVPTKKRTGREVYTPTRKPLYPFEKKTVPVKQEKVLRRARTAEVLRVPTGDSTLTADSREAKLKRNGILTEKKTRPHTTIGREDVLNSSQQSIKKPTGRKTTKSQSPSLSQSLESLGKDSDDSKSTSHSLSGSSSASSASCEVKDRRAVSDAAQIEIGKKLTKRNSQLGGSSSSLTKERAGKGPIMMRRSSLPGSGGVSGKRSSSRSTTVKTPQITIGEDSPSASKDRQSGSSSTLRITKIAGEVASLQISEGTDAKPPRPQKKTQFASSFNELKQVHRGTRTNSSRSSSSEGRHGEAQ